MKPQSPLWDEDRFDELVGHAETLTTVEPSPVDQAVERAVAAARRAGGVEFERAVGFAPARRVA